MLKILRLLAALVLLGPGLHAQNLAVPPPETSNWLSELHSALNPLDAGRLSSGVLLDRVVPWSQPHQHNGTGAVVNTYANWEQQYFEFYYASLNRGGLPTPEEVKGRVQARLAQGQVPLLVLHYRYDELRPDAAQQGLIQIDSINALVTDGPDVSRSPYQQGEVYAIGIPLEYVPGAQQVQLYVGPEFCFGNVAPTANLWLNPGGAAGWQQVTLGGAVAVSLNPAAGASQTVQFYDNGLYASTAVAQRTVAASLPPDMALGIVASRSWPGPAQHAIAKGIAWVRWADDNRPAVPGQGKFRRPMVFVEGIDFSYNRGKEQRRPCPIIWPQQTGAIPLSDFDNSCPNGLGVGNYRNGEAGWNEMVDFNSDYPSLEKLPALRQQLQAASGGGYDVIYLDFSDGADLIQQNAMLLVELLEYINDPAHRAANAEETLVIGASMGGQVSRFALAWMEQQGLCHNTKLWVSMDSPNRGANVPLGCQYMLQRLSDTQFGGSAVEAVNKLYRPASRQMIIYHFDDNAAASYRNQWQGWQSSAGSYPGFMRRVAVANGSDNATPQPGMWPGMELIRTNTFNPTTGQAYAFALPGSTFKGTSNVVFRWRVPFGLTWHKVTRPASIPQYDTAPGSTYGTVRIMNQSAPGTLVMGNSETNAYMLTSSALDIFAAGPIGAVNVNYNVRQNLPASDAPDRSKYAFDAYFAQPVNEPHVQITNGQGSATGNPSYYYNNADWISNELRQSAHGLGGQLSGTYNYGSPYRHLLPSVDIGDGGRLYLNNGSLPPSGGWGPQPALQAGIFDVYTSGCGSTVRVQTGGQLLIGQAGTGYRATLTVVKRSLLDVQPGGVVRVPAGSTLYVKDGGSLLVRNGGTLQVDGQVIVSGGYMCVEAGANLVFSAGATLQLDQDAHPGSVNAALALAPAPVCSPDWRVCGQFTNNSGTPVNNTGGQNEALAFDGVDDYVTIPVPAPSPSAAYFNELGTEFTIEAFIRPTALGGNQTIFSNRRQNASKTWGWEGALFTLHNGNLLLQLDGVNFGNVAATQFPTDGLCHHVAVRRDAGYNLRFYLDGRPLAYAANTARGAYSPVAANLGADAGYGYYSEFFPGDMGEVRVWNAARSDADVLRYMTAKLEPTPQFGLVAYYDMNNASGSQVSDLSGATAGGSRPLVPGTLGGGGAAPQWLAYCSLACTVQGNYRTAGSGAIALTRSADDTTGIARTSAWNGKSQSPSPFARLTLVPNPSHGAATLHWVQTAESRVRVRILDLAGLERATPQPETKLAAGEHRVALPVGKLPAGLYLVTVESNRGREFVRLQVQ